MLDRDPIVERCLCSGAPPPQAPLGRMCPWVEAAGGSMTRYYFPELLILTEHVLLVGMIYRALSAGLSSLKSSNSWFTHACIPPPRVRRRTNGQLIQWKLQRRQTIRASAGIQPGPSNKCCIYLQPDNFLKPSDHTGSWMSEVTCADPQKWGQTSGRRGRW